MANGLKPAYFSDQYASVPGWNRLVIKYTCGSSGAVPTYPGSLTLAPTDQVSNVALSGTGVLTVTLRDQWEHYIGKTADIVQSSYSASGACGLKTTTVNSGNSTQNLVFTFVTAAGAAVNPASGDIVILVIDLMHLVAPGD